jgi:hypothetical protein
MQSSSILNHQSRHVPLVPGPPRHLPLSLPRYSYFSQQPNNRTTKKKPRDNQHDKLATMAPPRRSKASYINAVFAIFLYGIPAWWLWYQFANSNSTIWLGGWNPLIVPCAIVLSFLSLLQIFGLYQEYIGNDWQQHPITTEWSKME